MRIDLIPVGDDPPNSLNVIIEVPVGGEPVKYEFDKASGALFVDRILHTPMRYPANYGFIPRTYADDNDPLDVLLLSSEVILPMSLVECYPIGVIVMEDGGYLDEKIIAVPSGDPTYNGYNRIEALPVHIAQEMTHFFSVYKELEGKSTALDSVRGADAAREIIRKCIELYKKKFRTK